MRHLTHLPSMSPERLADTFWRDNAVSMLPPAPAANCRCVVTTKEAMRAAMQGNDDRLLPAHVLMEGWQR